jgi:HTH-type transcriptional regulator/antitoxin HigA
MKIAPIHTEAQYQDALKAISVLIGLDPECATPEGNELEILGVLVANYEASRFALELPDPIEAIKFQMTQHGLSVQNLQTLLGASHNASDVLSRKQALSLTMIRQLHAHLGISAECLIGAAS